MRNTRYCSPKPETEKRHRAGIKKAAGYQAPFSLAVDRKQCALTAASLPFWEATSGWTRRGAIIVLFNPARQPGSPEPS